MHKTAAFGIIFDKGVDIAMNDEDERYNDEKSDSGDWYVSVRICQIILCSILTIVLCGTLYMGKSERLRSGYKYLTDFSITSSDISDAVESIKHLIGNSANAEIQD